MDPTDVTPGGGTEGDEDAPPPASGAQPPQPADETPIDALNILPLLLEYKDGEFMKKEAARVVSSTKEDDESRADFMKRYADQLKLYAGLVKDLGYPAQGAKAPHISIMTKALLHLWARTYDQIVPAKGDIVKGKPLGPKDMERAQRVEKHMNWQLRYRMPDWGTSHQFTILAWLMAGSAFRHYRWDPIAHTHVIDHLPIEDVIVSYTSNDTHPQMKNVERVTVVLRLAKWELQQYQGKGFYSNLEAIFPDLATDGEASGNDGSTTDGDNIPSSNNDENPVRTASDKIGGVDEPTKKTKHSKRELYSQNTMLSFPQDLDDQGAGLAGQTKPVTIVVDKLTKKPLSVTIREEPDAIDQERFNQESTAYKLAMQNAARMQAMPPPIQPPAPNVASPMPGAPGGVPPTGLPAGGPQPPQPPKVPRPVRMQTIYRIIHFGLFPNPEGFYRLGVGYLLQGSNELANELAAAYMLSAQFSNMNTGFMAKGTRAKGGDLQVNHGKYIETELDPEQLDKAIKPLLMHPPSEGLMKVVDKLEANSEIAASADILSGEKGASNETAKGTSIRNENAMALIGVMSRLYLDSLKYELKLVAHGNSIYLDEFEYFPFTSDIPGQPGQQQVIQEKIFRSDYVEDVHLEFTADSRMTSKTERVSDAKDFLQLILNSPLAQNIILVFFALKQIFVMAEAPEYIAAMGQPPAPPPPPTPESQVTENAGFLNEKDHPVLPDDNHLLHLHAINELKQSPLHERMSSTGKQMLDRHERAHFAQLYQQEQALKEEQHGLGAGPGGAPGVLPGANGGQPPPPPSGAPGPGLQVPPNGGSPG
jgi:hypothetical protein